MSSPTDITERRRKAKKVAKGSSRKKANRKYGTTPALFALVSTKGKSGAQN